MKFWLMVPAIVALVWAESNPEADPDAEVPHHAVPHHPAPYSPTPPAYGYTPAYGHEAPAYTPAPPHYGPHPTPVYPAAPHPGAHHGPAHPAAPHHGGYHAEPAYHGPPKCAKLHAHALYCLKDPEYPTYEIQQAIEYHYDAVQQLYKDVLANTENSVDRLKDIVQETYLCPSEVKYLQPSRAINVHGKWRIIVNGVKAHYETLSQTARVEECTTPGSHCPLVPECYETKCLQKSIYHRFLVYDPYDAYLPFAIESFKLPSACACYNGAFHPKH